MIVSDDWTDSLLESAFNRIGEAMDAVNDILDWAEEAGYPAIQHKLEETLGPLDSARWAAIQYDDGDLKQR